MKLAFVTIALGTAAPSMAAQITFEGLNGFGETEIPDGYSGLNWDNLYSLTASNFASSGYPASVVSGSNIAFNGFGAPASFSSATPFTLNSGYFTAAFNDGLTVNVSGFIGAALTYSKVFQVNTSGPSLETFGWAGLTNVVLTSVGGTPRAGFGGSGTNFALDDLMINAPVSTGAVPEPITWTMMMIGFGAVGFAMRRQRNVTTTVRFV
ncbi:PEPxxWA-CTERM sorting domain-containing protein [Sphingomonas bacterium]|uniref:PEPxxWA-CTERM sorting domain-containing protein n=1 Tax=Sphingomonas bacterium TaxID=1895847 RepID=UPI0020C71200|nr:PEPxxWA-CTERM sorting domain-containing protein [Sphingomonas bacterium]